MGFKKGHPNFRKNSPWNKGKKGVQIAWNKGLPKEQQPCYKKPSWNKGKKDWMSDKQKNIIREKCSGKNQWQWKGNKVGYRALHNWIRSHKPKSLYCEKCGKVTDKLDASSIDHTYERDISKWRWLCRKCHKQGDKN